MERAVYRIIDANFNRGREAARVVEEFCRFYLNSAALTERAKRLRHELSAAINKLDAVQLLGGRDTLTDVGAPNQRSGIGGQGSGKESSSTLTPDPWTLSPTYERTDLKSVFTAACKRLTEALRTLTEVTQSHNRDVAQTMERLRFDAYALEKDIVLYSEPAEKFKRVKLYVVISSIFPADVICLTYRCVSGSADCIQLRAKDINDDSLFAMAAEFVQICKSAGVLSIINDRVDVAVAAGADGVHLGQNDLPVEQAKRLAVSPLIIGKSTHSLDQLRSACAACPTYVSLGPVFATVTKPQALPVGLDYVKAAAEQLENTGISSVAIGGITQDNVEKVLEAGAKAIAVCSAVTEAGNPAEVCLELKEKITAFNKTRT